MKPALTLSTKEFSRDMREVLRLRKTDEVKVLNRAGRNVSFRAEKLTPKAKPARIRRDLGKKVSRSNGKGRTKLLYLLAMQDARKNGRGKMTREEVVEAIQKFSKKRLSSRNYISVGWFKVARDFGAKVRRLPSAKGEAGKSSGQQAKINRLVATLTNTARGASKVGVVALQAAVDQTAREMVAFAREEFAKSDRKLRK